MRLNEPERVGWGRLSAMALAVLALYGVWMIGRVRAQGQERMRRLGAELGRLEAEPGPREIVLNGARVRVTSAVAPDSLTEVLDHAHADCLGADEPSWLDPVMRWEDDGEGFVGCLGARAGGLEWEVFHRTGDLEDVGGFRYAYAWTDEDARGVTRTRLVAVRSVGAFALERMFPSEGDAPGFDLEHVRRAEGARRTLSVRELGRALTVHRAPAGTDLYGHHRRALEEEGWTVTAAGDALHAERAGASLVLSFGADDRGAWVTAAHEDAP